MVRSRHRPPFLRQLKSLVNYCVFRKTFKTIRGIDSIAEAQIFIQAFSGERLTGTRCPFAMGQSGLVTCKTFTT